MQRFNERQGFLVSATVHLLVLMILARSPLAQKEAEQKKPTPPKEAVFLPPAAVLKQLVPAEPRSAQRPPPPIVRRPQPEATPVPLPPDVQKKNKISIGAEADKTKQPMVLRRNEDIVAPKGRPDQGPSPVPNLPRQAAAEPPSGGAREVPGIPGMKMPPLPNGAGTTSGDDGSRPRPGAVGPISRSLANLGDRLQPGPRGIVTGTGTQMGPLFFDPEGADFTVWINHFKNEVYRNWTIPEPALFGAGGHVDIEFTVERDGKLSALRLLKSSGTTALDRAAEAALRSATFLALPADFGPARVTMQVSFHYNEERRAS